MAAPSRFGYSQTVRLQFHEFSFDMGFSGMSELLSTKRFPLFHEYYDELVTYLTMKLRSRDQAMDVAQETFLRVLTQPPSRPILQPRAFLYKTALNLSIDLFRKRKRQAEETLDTEELHDVLTVPADQDTLIEFKEQVQRLHQAVQELPPKCRQVFLLHKFKERSHTEISAQLGISKSMVEKHIIKAMAHCRERFVDTP